MLFRFYSKDRIYDTSSNLKWISLFSVLTIKRFFSVSLFKLNVNSISLSVIFIIFEFLFNVVPISGAIPILYYCLPIITPIPCLSINSLS